MARVNTLTNFLTDVASAIKEKKGDNTPILASDFDTEIENLPSGGNPFEEIGYNEIPTSIQDAIDYAKTIANNYTTGQKFQWNRDLIYMPFVDTSEETSWASKFYSCDYMISIPLLNTSNVTNMSSAFYNCENLIDFPQLDTSNVTNFYQILYVGSGISRIKSIPELNFQSATDIREMFNAVTRLTNLGGFKDLGKAYDTTKSENYNSYTLNLSRMSLTHESLMNVINKLYDIKTKGCQNQSLVLGNTNLAKLTAEEIAIATDKGWNVS